MFLCNHFYWDQQIIYCDQEMNVLYQLLKLLSNANQPLYLFQLISNIQSSNYPSLPPGLGSRDPLRVARRWTAAVASWTWRWPRAGARASAWCRRRSFGAPGRRTRCGHRWPAALPPSRLCRLLSCR